MYDRGGVVIDFNANDYPQGSTNEWSYDRTRIEMMVFLWCLQAGHNRIDRREQTAIGCFAYR